MGFVTGFRVGPVRGVEEGRILDCAAERVAMNQNVYI